MEGMLSSQPACSSQRQYTVAGVVKAQFSVLAMRKPGAQQMQSEQTLLGLCPTESIRQARFQLIYCLRNLPFGAMLFSSKANLGL